MMFRWNPKIFQVLSAVLMLAFWLGLVLWLFPELEQFMFFLGEDHRVVESAPLTFIGSAVFNEMYEMSKKIKELEIYRKWDNQ